MFDSLSMSYLAPTGEPPIIPLGGHLPPCPHGQISQWLQAHTPAGSWVIDPFGATPLTAIQSAKAGYRILVAANNPLLDFETELLCRIPPRNEFQSALSELASSRRGDMRLETLIQSFYLTRCATCGKEVPAKAFLWKRNEKSPYARIYECPACGDEGLHPADDSDAERLAPLLRAEPLHRSRALEKAFSPGMDEDEKRNVEEALKAYPVRSLVVIFNLLNKLDAFPLNSHNLELLQALLLPVLDAGTNLWPYPAVEEAPHLLLTPAEYIEKNLWLELESAVDLWQTASSQLDCTHWPEMPKQAGICIYPGRVKEFTLEPNIPDFSAVVCNLPRPSQAFWTLSALWSAWLWGKETSARYTGVLGRRRFDWHWHTRALHSPLEAVSHLVHPGTPVLGLMQGAVPGFILSAVSAASAGGLSLKGFTCREEQTEVQFDFRTSTQPDQKGRENQQELMREAVRQTFLTIGHPTNYLSPYTAAVVSLGQRGVLPNPDDPAMPETFSEVQNSITKLFLDRTFLHHYESAAQEIEAGRWFLEVTEGCQLSLDDRVEMEIVNLLLGPEGFTLPEIQQRVYSSLAGILVPSLTLIHTCLDSYADQDPSNGLLQMKAGETPAERKAEISKMRKFIRGIAARVGLTAEGDLPILWKRTGDNNELYRFYLGASAIFENHVSQENREDTQSVVVFPGSRANLISYKLAHNPWLRERTHQNWHFLKFRYLEALAQRSELNLELWQLLLDGDPLSSEKDTQLSIFL